MITGESLIIKTPNLGVKSVKANVFIKCLNNCFEKISDEIEGEEVDNDYVINIEPTITIKFTPITVVVLTLTMDDDTIVKKDLFYNVKQFK